MFTAEFYGLQNLLAEKLGVHGIFNVVGAGSATAATFGLISNNSYHMHENCFALPFLFVGLVH
jgi:hypothetical protein